MASSVQLTLSDSNHKVFMEHKQFRPRRFTLRSLLLVVTVSCLLLALAKGCDRYEYALVDTSIILRDRQTHQEWHLMEVP